MADYIKRYQYIIYVGISLGILDLYIRFINRGLGFISYIDLSPILFTLAWIFFFIGIITLLKGKLKKITYILILIIYNLLMLTNYIFLKIFGTAFSINTFGLADEGKDYYNVIFNYISWPIILIIITNIIFIIINIKVMPKDRKKQDIFVGISILIIAVSLFFSARYFLGEKADETAWDAWAHKRNVYDSFSDSRKSLQVSGLFEYTFRDLYLNTIAKQFENNDEKTTYLNQYYSKYDKSNNGSDLSSVFKDKNVIVVLMESTDDWIVTEERMPTLYNMMHEGINFTGHYSPIYGGGATFNSEFMVNTGYMTPLNEETAANQYGYSSFPYSLANLFKNDGYIVNNFHENIGSFYNRKQMSKVFGYENYYGSLDMGIETSVAAKDSHLMTNTKIRDLIIRDEKFMSFVTTYSLHTEYKLNTTIGNVCTYTATNKEKEAIENGGNEQEICIDAQAKETDNFFKLLLKELKAKGKLDDTVIVGVSDHYAYGYSNLEKLYQLKGTSDENLISNVPFFIWSNDIEPQEITKVNSNLDVVPTIADLFGLDYKTKNYVGNNIFDDDYNGYVFFKDYSWYDGTTYYKNGQTISGNATEDYIKTMNKKINQTLTINKYILDTDYFKNN